MVSGGSRVVSGPPPDPNALRRNRPGDAAGWRTLPAEGPSAPPPSWPLVSHPDPIMAAREAELWDDLWRRPQAEAWADLGQDYEVGMYVRKLAEAEQPRASVELQKVVRQYLDSLGLSVQGMLRNRWKIAPPLEDDTERADVTTYGDPETKTVPVRKSSRDRFKVVAGGGA